MLTLIFDDEFIHVVNLILMSLADPGGALPARTPPNRINFFRFCICFHQKVYASEVGAPPQRVGAPPPTGNPGSATEC